MKTARIVILTMAVGAGSAAAYIVSGSDRKTDSIAMTVPETEPADTAPLTTGSIGHLPVFAGIHPNALDEASARARLTAMLPPDLRGFADTDSIMTTDTSRDGGWRDSVSLARYDVSTTTAIRK